MRALCDTLQLEGLRHPGFGSARQASAALQPGEFDLLLTDLMMPEMDGIALIDAARQIDPTLGAIVMTGHGTIDTAVQAMQGGALDYILKPFKLNVILPVIARALDVQRLRRENAELQEREQRRSEPNWPPPITIWSPFPTRSPTICVRRCAPSMAFRQILEEEFAKQLGEEGRRIIGIIRGGSQKNGSAHRRAARILARRPTTARPRPHRHDSAGRCGGRARRGRCMRVRRPCIEIAELPAMRRGCDRACVRCGAISSATP